MRLIAKLDVKPPNVVKPIMFEGLRKIGSPENISKEYYQEGIDEIYFIDFVASLYRREIQYKLIKKTAQSLFIPFVVGGGINSIDQVHRLYECGVDKITMNTHLLQSDPSLIEKITKIYGSQALSINIEAKYFEKNWLCVTDGGRQKSIKNLIIWAKEVQDRGCGEIFLQSVDLDGTLSGPDTNLLHYIRSYINVPLVYCGGIASTKQVKELNQFNLSGISISSALHYKKINITKLKKILKL